MVFSLKVLLALLSVAFACAQNYFYYYPYVKNQRQQYYPVRTNCQNRCISQVRYRWTYRPITISEIFIILTIAYDLRWKRLISAYNKCRWIQTDSKSEAPCSKLFAKDNITSDLYNDNYPNYH